MAFKLMSAAFAEGGWIPSIHTCQGANVSPSLEWSGEPPETRSFALVVEDPDAPVGIWTHWLFYDIPSQIHDLAQSFRAGTLGFSGTNDFGKPGYGGPCPPKGHGPHRYFFRLFAVDTPTLGLPPGAGAADVKRALRGHTLGEAQTLGRFERA